MTEKQKMLDGSYYNPRDPELLERYHYARKLLATYNHLNSSESRRRKELLSELLEQVGSGVWIETPFFCDYGEHISVDANTFINTNCIFLDDNKIRIGKNSLIGPYVQIYTASHPLRAAERILPEATWSKDKPVYLTHSKPVTVGDNVWIGGNTVILPGVRIGSNTTIGASSLVTKDIPDNVLAMGNPCVVMKQL